MILLLLSIWIGYNIFILLTAIALCLYVKERPRAYRRPELIELGLPGDSIQKWLIPLVDRKNQMWVNNRLSKEIH